jgi:Beta-propeller repeat
VPQLEGSLALEGTAPVEGSTVAATARSRWAAVGLLIVLALSVIAALSERESPSGQLGSAGAQPGSQVLPASLGLQSTSLAAAQAPSTALRADTTQPALPAGARRGAASAYAKLPLSFIPNRGQTAKQVRYYAQGAGYSFFFTDKKAVLALQKGHRGQALDLRFSGANPNAELMPADRASGRINFLTGSERHTNLPTYERLTYRNLWPGIDMVFRGKGGKLNYEFRLRPGANASDIRLAYVGAEGVSLGAGGALQIDTPLGTLRDARPQSFQRIDGRRVPVDSRYALVGHSYGFSVGRHDRRQPLVIDPSLAYSTYLGGSGFDEGLGIAVDSAGAAYVTGSTFSPDFPTTAGAFDTNGNGLSDAFVTKLNAAGSGLAYSTYLGGFSFDQGRGIAVDSAGAAYVTGLTDSPDFLTTAGAFDTSANGDFDAFVTKLDPTGTGLAYSTYLGGSRFDEVRGIAIDSAGSAYVSGETPSTDFPTTAGAFDTSFNGDHEAFVTKLNPAGSGLAYSTYLGGGSGDGGGHIAVDSLGAAYVAGGTASVDFPTTAGAFDTSFNGYSDAFVTKLNPAGSGLAYSTYLGGSSGDGGSSIAVDSLGAAYVTGSTGSTDFPASAGTFDATYNGNGDAFVTKLNPAGSGLAYSTYLGGSSEDPAFVIAVDAAGAAYVTGFTSSIDLPTTTGVFDTSFNGGRDAFVTKLDSTGSSLAYSTYLGGSNTERGFGIAVDSAGAAYVIGDTFSTDFPTTAGAFDTSANGGDAAFITKLSFGPPTSTPRCKVTGGGRITADNGDKATFSGNPQSDAAGSVKGQEQYQDQGPAQPHSVKSIRILALTCNPARTQATIFGEATIDGSGTHAFTIDVQDLGEPGKGADTYWIQLDTGYDSGQHPLQGGNVQIQRP